jgi:hypothetical protein
MKIFLSILYHLFVKYTPVLASVSAAVNLTLILLYDLPVEDIRFYAISGSCSAAIGWMMLYLTEENVRSILVELLDSVKETE